MNNGQDTLFQMKTDFLSCSWRWFRWQGVVEGWWSCIFNKLASWVPRLVCGVLDYPNGNSKPLMRRALSKVPNPNWMPKFTLNVFSQRVVVTAYQRFPMEVPCVCSSALTWVTKSTLSASSLLAARPGKIFIWICDLCEPLETANREVTHPIIEMSSILNFLSALGKSKTWSPSPEGQTSNSHPENFLLSQVL